MEIRDVLFFDKMLVPTVITVIYWVALVLCVIGGIVTMTQSFWSGLALLIFGPLAARFYSEIIIVLFKMNEALQEIRRK